MDQEPIRKRLPDTRPAYTHKGVLGNHDYYVTVGFHDDNPQDLARPGEIFVKVGKYGGDVAVFVDGWAQMVSLALQYGVRWEQIRGKFENYQYPNLLQAAAQAVDQCIKIRRETLGLDEPKSEDA